MISYFQQLYKSILSTETRKRLYKLRNLRGYKHLRSSVSQSPKGSFSLKPFEEHECIFVHITKTAGTSVAKSLFGYLPYHYTAIDYRMIYGKRNFYRYFKFAFVRNPWDRVYSAYRYLKSGGWNDDDRSWSDKNISQFDDFNQFAESWLTQSNIRKHIHFMPQHEFLCDNKGNILIDYLAYFETINDDFRKIALRLNVNADIGRHNTNPAESYRTIYNQKSRQIVAEVYSKDISLFGYNFDGIERRRVISNN